MSVISGTVLIHARALIQENNHEQAVSDIMSYQSSQDQKDTAQFDKLGAQWWDQNGPMGPLHHFTPIRLQFILDMISRYDIADHIADKTQSESQPLNGLRILDIGCGGGLLEAFGNALCAHPALMHQPLRLKQQNHMRSVKG